MTIFDVRPEAGLERVPDGNGWVAASHAAVNAVLREPGWSSDHRKATGHAEYQAERGIPEVADELLAKVLLFMDAPDHTRLRGLISKAFKPRSIERLRTRVNQLTDELLTTVVLLLTAGHETTMNLIGNGLLALLRNPDQLEVLRARPDLMPGAVEELLRYDSPVRLTVRTALEDATVTGSTVRAGEQVVAMLDAANHDPAVFESPDILDVTRDAHRHVAFGAGAHYCLGAALARAEAQAALAALTAVPELELAIDQPARRPLVTFHALQSLPVACRPAC